jgi:putative ABC transport system substrate-binding protein
MDAATCLILLVFFLGISVSAPWLSGGIRRRRLIARKQADLLDFLHALHIRHIVLVAIMATAILVPIAARAQTARSYRIGTLGAETAEGKAYGETFLATLRDLGYVQGRNLIVDVRYYGLDVKQLPAAVDELIALKPDVLLAWETGAQAMRAKTTSIPIVLVGAVDPVRAGLAQSLARPGLNVTGIAQLSDTLSAKHIDIMREIRPRLAKVGQLVDTSGSTCRVIEENSRQAARRIGAVLIPYYVMNRTDLEGAFSEMAKERPDVLLPCPSPVLFSYRDFLFESVVRLRIPLSSFVVGNVPDGVLFAYAASLHEVNRRAAVYVDRILKGANPADLPIEQPTTFELVVNLRTAKALGLTIPPSLLFRADRVIE